MTKKLTENSALVGRPEVTLGIFTFHKPNAVAIITTLLLVGMCVWLGVWQVQRLAWKQDLIARLQKNSKQVTLYKETLPKNLDDLVKEEFRYVLLPGEFVHEHEFHLTGRRHETVVGYEIVTPFRIADDGRMILVNRGWVPADKKDPAKRTEDARFGGIVFVSGMLLAPVKGPSYLPKNDVERNVWITADTKQMEEVSGLDLPPVIIEAINAEPMPDSLPIPRTSGEVRLHNDHRNYAFIWFSLALAGLTIFFIYHLKSVKGDEEEASA